jgi:DNA-directed RNA polymerase subunit M/transcription elongation factor TFIIS
MSQEMTLAVVKEGTTPRVRFTAINMLCELNGLSWEDAEKVDTGIIRFSLESDGYIDIAKRICHNLHYNSEVIKHFRLDELAGLTNDQMKSDVLKRFQAAELERANGISDMLKQKYDAVNSTSLKQSLLKCRSCGSSDINWTQKQTRGADESMTIFCSCGKCGNRWRMS